MGRINIINVESEETLQRLYNGSALTIEGLALESIDCLADWLEFMGNGKLKRNECFLISGAFMNKSYGLTGSNAYQDNLNIVSFELDNIPDVPAIVIPRFDFGGRWFDDIVDNNLMREEAKWTQVS